MCWDIFSQELQRLNNSNQITIGGFQKQSLIDYPGNISSVIFTQGCNFRCIYCHNADLVLPEKTNKLRKFDPEFIYDWIAENIIMIDAVVFTGGEPTLHVSLPEYISRFKKLGLKIKLDTNGTNPDMLEQLIENNLLDYVAMDIKTPLKLNKYQEIAGKEVTETMFNRIKKSADILCNTRHIDYEFRTTIFDKYFSFDTIHEIAGSISGKLYLQNYQPPNLTGKQNLRPYPGFDTLENHHYKSALIELRK